MRSQTKLAFYCPQCGQRMTTIRVATTLPSIATLVGCERCGITLNELPRPEFPPPGVPLVPHED